MHMLDIIIPTYNRAHNLSHFLESLALQSCQLFNVIVVDNASFDDTATVCEYYLKKHFGDRMVLLTNQLNIGADPNICKAFQVGLSPWMLVIGDSKPLIKDAIGLILSSIHHNSDVGFINFYFPDRLHRKRARDIHLAVSDDLLSNTDSFGNLLLLGNTVFRRHAVLDLHQNIFLWANTCAVQFLICYYISFKYSCLLSRMQIVDLMLDKRKYECLPMADAWVGFSRVTSYLFSFRDCFKFRQLVSQSLIFPGSSLNLIYSIAKKSLQAPSYRFSLFYYWTSLGRLIVPFNLFTFVMLSFFISLLLLTPFSSLLLRHIFAFFFRGRAGA